MSQTRWSSLSAAIVISALSLMSVSQAKDIQVLSSPSSDEVSNDSAILETSVTPEEEGQKLASPQPDAALSSNSPVKVGAVQSQSSREGEENVVARIVPHEYNDHSAATLYLRNIPVLTFLEPGSPAIYPDIEVSDSPLPVEDESQSKVIHNRKTASSSSGISENGDDPTWQAARVAATLNELARQDSEEDITVQWAADRSAYLIVQGNIEIAAVTPLSVLPDTTQNWEADALQVTNRLRRLLHQDPPLRQLDSTRIVSPPDPPSQTAAAVPAPINGWASWYGPGFHSAYSASGEVFNPQAMTAAHLTLPFGTQVRVTNLENGRSVVVRINDRGPYLPGRILDVSEAAAIALGMIQTGVAPIRLDILQGQ